MGDQGGVLSKSLNGTNCIGYGTTSIYERGESALIIYKMLSQGSFCKILKFAIDYVIKYSWLRWKRIQHYNVLYNIITLYKIHE